MTEKWRWTKGGRGSDSKHTINQLQPYNQSGVNNHKYCCGPINHSDNETKF